MLYTTGWASQPSEDKSQSFFFFKGRETLLEYNKAFISEKYESVNPFLFIRGLSCPRSVQTSLTQNILRLTIPGHWLKETLGQVLAWK
jgi:hypothetical protein